MPKFHQGTAIPIPSGSIIPPLAAVRAGTVNPAGGLATGIDCRGYSSVTLNTLYGALPGSGACKLQDAAVSGGPYVDTSGGAQPAGVANTLQRLDLKLTPGRPWVQIVLVTTNAGDVSSAFLQLVGPTATNRT